MLPTFRIQIPAADKKNEIITFPETKVINERLPEYHTIFLDFFLSQNNRKDQHPRANRIRTEDL